MSECGCIGENIGFAQGRAWFEGLEFPHLSSELKVSSARALCPTALDFKTCEDTVSIINCNNT